MKTKAIKKIMGTLHYIALIGGAICTGAIIHQLIK